MMTKNYIFVLYIRCKKQDFDAKRSWKMRSSIYKIALGFNGGVSMNIKCTRDFCKFAYYIRIENKFSGKIAC